METMPPMDKSRLIVPRAPRMSDGAKRLHILRNWHAQCLEDRRLDADEWQTYCRLREHAAHLIGFMA